MKNSPLLTGLLRWPLRGACAVTWIAAFVATHVSADRIPSTSVGDKTLHFVGYFVLCCLLVLVLRAWALPWTKRVAVAICIMAVYAAFDELTQPPLGRSASFLDWVADVLGAITGATLTEAALMLWSLRRVIRKQQ